MDSTEDDDIALPIGDLALQTVAMPKDANYQGDIFGGWLVSQMDMAGGICAHRLAKGRVATVAIDSMVFMRPVPIGAVISCYTKVLNIGHSSMKILVEVWVSDDYTSQRKVTEGQFSFVAIDNKGRTRAVLK